MTRTRAAGDLYYLYALADRRLPRRFVANRRLLRTIDIDGLSAIVERISKPRAATEQTLVAQHAIVVRLARRVDALLPVRFGAQFTLAELDARVKSAHDEISGALDRVRGRVQMTVRVEPAPAAGTPGRPTSGTAYLAGRRAGADRLRRTAAEIRRAVSPFVVDERVEEGKGSLPPAVYHLIEAADVERYRRALARMPVPRANGHLTLTGPWPVFAFVPRLERG